MESLEQVIAEEPQGPGAPPTLRAHVVQMLSAGILSGKYKPGDRLNESQIARELNISRIPVREALSQLQEQGLVQNRERRGMFVTNITTEEVLQISSLRLILETRSPAPGPDPHDAGNRGRAGSPGGADGELGRQPLGCARPGPSVPPHPVAGLRQPLSGTHPYGLVIPLFAHKTLEHVTHDARRWRMSHHRTLLDAIMGRSGDDLQAVLLTHLRMSHTEPERYSAAVRKPS